VCVRYDDLADRAGNAHAHKLAADYCALLKEQLGRFPGYALGETEDAARDAGRGRKRDLEGTFFMFEIVRADGGYHDGALREGFRVAGLRAAQAWDEGEGRAQTRHRDRARRSSAAGSPGCWRETPTRTWTRKPKAACGSRCRRWPSRREGAG
jgi:hypothetical protein